MSGIAGAVARKRAAGAQFFEGSVADPFRASRSFAGGTPAVPDNHLTLAVGGSHWVFFFVFSVHHGRAVEAV